jgi:hypothetical protein
MHNAIERIRHAIERGDFASARALWEEWACDLGSRIQAGSASPADWTRTTELYLWSRDVLKCARAQALDRLNTLHAAGAYVRGSW